MKKEKVTVCRGPFFEKETPNKTLHPGRKSLERRIGKERGKEGALLGGNNSCPLWTEGNFSSKE